jgi:hypothetical protein
LRAERALGAAKNKGKFSILIKHDNNNNNKSNSRFSTRRSAADYFRTHARTPVRTLTVWSEFGQAREERDGVY